MVGCKDLVKKIQVHTVHFALIVFIRACFHRSEDCLDGENIRGYYTT